MLTPSYACTGTRPLDRGTVILRDHVVKRGTDVAEPGSVGRPILSGPGATDERVGRHGVADVAVFTEERDDVVDVSVSLQCVEGIHESPGDVHRFRNLLRPGNRAPLPGADSWMNA
jgi:hypothetical protein